MAMTTTYRQAAMPRGTAEGMPEELEAVKRVRTWIRAQSRDLEKNTAVYMGGSVLREISRTQAAGARIVIVNLRRFLNEWEEGVRKEANLEPKKIARYARTHGPRPGTVRLIRKAKPLPGATGVAVGDSGIA